jgi:surfactin synthase thioesterase subunit
VFTGGHFFLTDHVDGIIKIIAQQLGVAGRARAAV